MKQQLYKINTELQQQVLPSLWSVRTESIGTENMSLDVTITAKCVLSRWSCLEMFQLCIKND